MKRRIIGIDVGKNGGIVVYDTENNRLLECINGFFQKFPEQNCHNCWRKYLKN